MAKKPVKKPMGKGGDSGISANELRMLIANIPRAIRDGLQLAQ